MSVKSAIKLFFCNQMSMFLLLENGAKKKKDKKDKRMLYLCC